MRPFWRKGGLRNTCCVGLTVSIVSYTGTRYIIIMTLLLSSYSMVHSFLRWSMLINPFNRHWLKLFLKEYSLWESTFKSKRLWGENNAKLFTSIITTIVQYSMKHTSRSSKCEFKRSFLLLYCSLGAVFVKGESFQKTNFFSVYLASHQNFVTHQRNVGGKKTTFLLLLLLLFSIVYVVLLLEATKNIDLNPSNRPTSSFE